MENISVQLIILLPNLLHVFHLFSTYYSFIFVLSTWAMKYYAISLTLHEETSQTDYFDIEPFFTDGEVIQRDAFVIFPKKGKIMDSLLGSFLSFFW